jgi:hypothetical protein
VKRPQCAADVDADANNAAAPHPVVAHAAAAKNAAA